MKLALILLASTAFASLPFLPKGALHHAHCDLHRTYDLPCNTLFSETVYRVSGYTPGPLGGTYNVTAAGMDGDDFFIRGYRTTPDGLWTDDVMWNFSQGEEYRDCIVQGQSKSREYSYNDEGNNFCNLDVPLNFATYSSQTLDDCQDFKEQCLPDTKN